MIQEVLSDPLRTHKNDWQKSRNNIDLECEMSTPKCVSNFNELVQKKLH